MYQERYITTQMVHIYHVHTPSVGVVQIARRALTLLPKYLQFTTIFFLFSLVSGLYRVHLCMQQCTLKYTSSCSDGLQEIL